MVRVLFVCTGNTCRSPMTEVLFRNMVEKAQKGHEILALSAGIAVGCDAPASEQAIEVMKHQGIDLAKHRTRALTPELVRAADLILTMTNSHKRAVLAMTPEAEGKVHTVRQFAEGLDGDIADPYGAPVEIYQACADEINSQLVKAWEKILQFDKQSAGENARA
jgi:protein-tyrosine-phosphatase